MQAIILAAGMGRRLNKLTENNTKCMIKVNGERLIDRMLVQLSDLGIKKVVIVIGYEGEKLKKYLESNYPDMDLRFVDNENYETTNNIYSLYMAKDYLLEEDTILLESDLIFEEDCLRRVVCSNYDNSCLLAPYELWMDGTVVTLNEKGEIADFIEKEDFSYGDYSKYFKTVNIYRLGAKFSERYYIPFLKAYIETFGSNYYYEQVLKVIALADKSLIKPIIIDNKSKWYEIDDVQDLEIASIIFEKDYGVKYDSLAKQYGGYWRYNDIHDYCYLVNPYYPPQKMLDEFQASFVKLIENYPSGLKRQNTLAAKYYDVNEDYIVVGNGASEIIKGLMRVLKGKVGIIRPSFEEYYNCLDENKVICRTYLNYGADELISFIKEDGLDNLVLLNPDNPSGNYIDYKNMIRLLDIAKENKTTVILDESFIDFAEERVTYIDDSILEKYNNLIVIKSISKSHGVPGVRLGVLVSADINVINLVKKELSIWNINSFGEYYLQCAGKYKNHFSKGIKRFLEVRKKFYEQLIEIKGIVVFPTQANYFMVELKNGIKARDLCIELLKKGFLIKDLSSKKGIDGQYIRVAVRTEEENNVLATVIKDIFNLVEV